jgi:glutathione synthase/RimK-type ligase-like ATP-grasp enzyme/gamma-glutamyl:cysteine ligase YbdK (ATP-grasp superfamily)
VSERVVVVVSDPADLPELAATVVPADRYLADGASDPGVTVINLCRSYRYRSKGYYVSLVADARGQRVVPTVGTLQGVSEPVGLLRVLREAGVPTAETAEVRARRRPAGAVAHMESGPGPAAGLAGTSTGLAVGEEAETLVILGRCPEPELQEVARSVFEAWPIPLARVRFARREGAWGVASVEPVPLRRLGDTDRARLVEALREASRNRLTAAWPARALKRASIAVLFDETDPFTPSSRETIEHLERFASSRDVHVHRIGLDDIDRLGEYDALFIRTLTGVREPSFQFALRAESLGMPVLDDPQSIIRCSNKVFLEELLRREGIPTPRTMIITPRTPWEEVVALGLPLVVKLPDGSFSSAVHRVSDAREFAAVTTDLFRRSPLLIAQEFLRTEFDWRVTVLDGRVLFAARYYMAAGHWQIRSENGTQESFGRVEPVPRERAPRDVVELALRAAALIGRGLYGVDIKEGPRGPVVIEINDNPNIDRGDDDRADGDLIYGDLLEHFVRKVAEWGAGPRSREERRPARPGMRRHYRPFSVAGMELEYAVVDAHLEVASLVEDAFRIIAGKATSDIDLGAAAGSNEIADHVFEVKTPVPMRSLHQTEEALVEGVRRFSEVLRTEFDARLLPTAMHPWMDPADARLWRRSGARVYQAYGRIFDLHTHGWMNVQAAHLNLPMGRGPEAAAMYNAASLLMPYLPAIAASSPIFDGRPGDSVDNRLTWIFEHQRRIPETQGDILPEFISSLPDYRRRILQPMYRALDSHPGSEVLRHEFLNARGAVLKLSRRALEIRVVDMQECVKLDVAIAAFTRAVLRHFTRDVLRSALALPPHRELLEDFRAVVRNGSDARVTAPHLGDAVERGADGRTGARDVLRHLLGLARRTVRREEDDYLDLVALIIEQGSLSERISESLRPFRNDPARFREATREVYLELAACLEANRPWVGRV